MANYLEQDLLTNYSNEGSHVRQQQQNISKANNSITPLHSDKIDLSGNDPRPLTYSAKVNISTPTKGSAAKRKTMIPKDPNRRASTVLNKMTKNKSKDRSNIFPAKYLVPSGSTKKSAYIQSKLKAVETSQMSDWHPPASVNDYYEMPDDI